jgi:hypothetical protein
MFRVRPGFQDLFRCIGADRYKVNSLTYKHEKVIEPKGELPFVRWCPISGDPNMGQAPFPARRMQVRQQPRSFLRDKKYAIVLSAI